MNKGIKFAVGALVALFVAQAVSFADTTTTVTNRGQAITVKTLGNVATDVKDADMYQDFSVYPTRLGQTGKIIRFYDVGACGSSSTNIIMLPKVKIPDNTLIRNGYYQILQAATPVTTNSIKLNASADILGSATNSIELAAGSRAAIVPVDGDAGTSVQASGDQYLTFSVNNTLTAGRFMVVLDCELAP